MYNYIIISEGISTVPKNKIRWEKLIKGSPLTRLRKNHSCIQIEHNISVVVAQSFCKVLHDK